MRIFGGFMWTCDGGKWGPRVESVVDYACEGCNLKVLWKIKGNAFCGAACGKILWKFKKSVGDGKIKPTKVWSGAVLYTYWITIEEN